MNGWLDLLASEPFSTAQEVSFLPEPIWALIVKYR